jgi:CheY-like chemotaxis protein
MKKTVLVVDDDKHVLNFVSNVVAPKQQHIDIETSLGRPDMHTIAKYDYVITDMNMNGYNQKNIPGYISGLYVVADAIYAKVPCVVVSGDAGGYVAGSSSAAYRHGTGEVILKPGNGSDSYFTWIAEKPEIFADGYMPQLKASNEDLWQKVFGKLRTREPLFEAIKENGDLFAPQTIIANYATHSCFGTKDDVEKFYAYCYSLRKI